MGDIGARKGTKQGTRYGDVELRYALVEYEGTEIITDFDVEEQRGAVIDRILIYGLRTTKEAEPGAQMNLDRVAYEGFTEIVEGN